MECFGEVVYINPKGSLGIDCMGDKQMERRTGRYIFMVLELVC